MTQESKSISQGKLRNTLGWMKMNLQLSKICGMCLKQCIEVNL